MTEDSRTKESVVAALEWLIVGLRGEREGYVRAASNEFFADNVGRAYRYQGRADQLSDVMSRVETLRTQVALEEELPRVYK